MSKTNAAQFYFDHFERVHGPENVSHLVVRRSLPPHAPFTYEVVYADEGYDPEPARQVESLRADAQGRTTYQRTVGQTDAEYEAFMQGVREKAKQELTAMGLSYE